MLVTSSVGVLAVIGLGISIGWAIYEFSTGENDLQFPLRQYYAINNPYGICTFGASMFVGLNTHTALDNAQLASDIRTVLAFGQSLSVVKLEDSWHSLNGLAAGREFEAFVNRVEPIVRAGRSANSLKRQSDPLIKTYLLDRRQKSVTRTSKGPGVL